MIKQSLCDPSQVPVGQQTSGNKSEAKRNVNFLFELAVIGMCLHFSYLLQYRTLSKSFPYLIQMRQKFCM